MDAYPIDDDAAGADVRLDPVLGASAWTGPALAADAAWIHRLTLDEADEVEAAAARVRDLPLAAIGAAEFPLPRLAARLARVRADMTGGAGVALLRGLPVADASDENAERVLWGIGRHLGAPYPQDASGALLHHVRDTGVGIVGRDDTRTYQTNQAQPWHNDGGDLFALLCYRTSSAGGRSRIASAHAAFDAVLAHDPDLARALQEPFWFDARGQQLTGRPRVQRVPIFTAWGGRLYALHKRHYVDLAQRFPEVPRLDARRTAALDLLDAVCEDPALHLEFDLEPGDVEIGHNFSVFHARTAFRDGAGELTRRHLLRLWLALPEGWPLPPAYRDTREFGPLLEYRGG